MPLTQTVYLVVFVDLSMPLLLTSTPLCNIYRVHWRLESRAITIVYGRVCIRPARREVVLGKVFRNWPWRSDMGLFDVKR